MNNMRFLYNDSIKEFLNTSFRLTLSSSNFSESIQLIFWDMVTDLIAVFPAKADVPIPVTG